MQNIDLNQAQVAADYIRQQFKLNDLPSTAVILGSGLGGFTGIVNIVKTLPYKDIPGFPATHVVGHKGQLSLALLGNGKYTLVMEGRFHYYEGYTPQIVTLPVVVLHLLGVKILVVSNAAGGINPKFTTGDLMIINDHLNFTGDNPLMGSNNNSLGPRFLDQTSPYDPALIELAKKLAPKCGVKPQEGSYLKLSGPAYETKAEIRAFGIMGIDAVGMSTVYEVMMANYLGMKVLGISSITNMGTGIVVGHFQDHDSVVNVSNQVTSKFSAWVKLILEEL